MIDRDRNDVLWSEMTPAERQAEKKEFLIFEVLETGCSKAAASLQWEQYLNQEGWTGRDEDILMERDRAYEEVQVLRASLATASPELAAEIRAFLGE
jgi:hypothetical protein